MYLPCKTQFDSAYLTFLDRRGGYIDVVMTLCFGKKLFNRSDQFTFNDLQLDLCINKQMILGIEATSSLGKFRRKI